MKKVNKNIMTFIIVFVIIILGLISGNIINFFTDEIGNSSDLWDENGSIQAFRIFTQNIESTFSEGLSYHKGFLDFNSAVQKNVGTAVVYKDDMTVVRSQSGYLSYVRDEIPKETLELRAENVSELYRVSKENGADFLYVMAPAKGYNMKYPENVVDYNKSNCDVFLEELETKNVPYYSLISQMQKEGITEEEMFFVTDHHWKPEYALWAANRVSEELYSCFGFSYDKEKLNIANYNEKVYENWFLGSQGKKTGRYFTPLGLDDISIFTPKFKTSFINTIAGKDYSVQGNFEEVLIYNEHIEEKDLYNKNPYAAYLGGDYREQVIENTDNKNGKRVLVLKDSFSCAFAPFFANVAKDTYLLDMRDYDEFAGDRINVGEYIKEIKPDIVIVMYTGVTGTDVLYEFE